MNTMKTFALTAILAGTTFFSFSQDNQTKTPEQRAEKRTEMLTKKLDLTADQQVKVAQINQSTAKEVDAIKNNNSLSKEDKKTQLKQLRDNKHQELRSVLNSDQQQKFDKIEEKREEGHEHHHQDKK